MTIHQIADGVTLHVGNCLDVLPSLALDPSTTVAITDPPWPEAKPELLAANKMDLEGASEALADLRQALPGKQIYAISAVAGSGFVPKMELTVGATVSTW